MSKKRRTENLSVKFVNRQVEGWAFGVADGLCCTKRASERS